MAVDSSGNAFTYNGSSWSAPVNILSGELFSVSCPSTSFCVAVGSGEALTYNGTSWSAPVTIDPHGNGGDFESVSCLSSSFCAAVGEIYVGAANGDDVGEAATYNGTSWSEPVHISGTVNFNSVSCPSTSFCAAVDDTGDAVIYNGTSWSASADIDSDGDLYSVSCPSVSFCVAVDSGGNVLTYNGRSWSTPVNVASDSYLFSVSCLSASFCVTVGETYAYQGIASTYNGASWSAPVDIDSHEQYTSVSCAAVSFCMDVGNAQAITYGSGSGYVPPQAVTGKLTKNEVKLGLVNALNTPGVGEAEFEGTVIPGSLPAEWHFEYGTGNPTGTVGISAPQPPYKTLTTAGTVKAGTLAPYVPGMVGPSPVITPYKRWWYRLVAADGKSTVYGQSVSFVPGNLLNPTGLDLTDGSQGPGRYNLELECQSSPCAELGTHDGTPRKSIKKVAGELVVSHFDPGNGQLEGTATLAGGIYAPEVGTNIPIPGFGYDGEFKVIGNIEVSLALLNFSLTRDSSPPALPPDYTCVFMQRPVECGTTSFKLAGEVSYGAKAGNAGYAGVEIHGPLGGSGNTWHLCWQNQRSCPPSTADSKKSAIGISDALGLTALIPSPVSLPLGVFGEVMNLVGKDPPAPRYAHIAPPAKMAPLRVRAGHGLSRGAAAAATEVLDRLTQASVYGAAFLNALQRYEGAQRAANTEWIARQAQAAARYGQQLIMQSQRLEAILNAQHHVLWVSPLNRQRLSGRTLKRFLRSDRRHGLSRRLTKELRRLGIEPASFHNTSAVLPTQVPASGSSLFGPILRPSFTGELKALAEAVNGYLQGLAQPSPA